MAQNDRHTNRQTNGHGDSMTDSAQRAESVKRNLYIIRMFIPGAKANPVFHQGPY